MTNSNIKITDNSDSPVSIDIEGVIGLLEEYQFADHDTAIATYQKFKTKIAQIKKINAKEIIVNIRSAGGNINDAILIYEALKGLSANITTRCYGYVASAATIIAQAASENRREIASSALYLIHNSIANIEGNSDEMRQTLNLIQTTDKTIAEIYALRAKKNSKLFSDLMNENSGKGRWLSPNEALEYKLVDNVIEAPCNISNSTEIISTLGLPPIPNSNNSLFKKLTRKWNEISQIVNLLNISKIDNSKPNNNSETLKQPTVLSRDEVIALDMKAKTKNSTQTNTQKKEDPTMDEIGITANANAYQSDIKQFKQ